MTQVTGQEHWTTKKTADGDVRLFLWEKFVGAPGGKPAVLFVHGSSMASQPTFDLSVPGPNSCGDPPSPAAREARYHPQNMGARNRLAIADLQIMNSVAFTVVRRYA